MPRETGSFAVVLRQMRNAAALSQEEQAERACLSARGISDLERGIRRRPHPETVRLLADALDLGVRDREVLFAAARGGDLAMGNRGQAPTATRLPLPQSLLFGRDEERAALSALLLANVQLITVTGMGGTGKTRLAIDVAGRLRDRFRDGVFFVDLAPVADPAHVVSTIADAVGNNVAQGMPILDGLAADLRDKQALVVLGTCEQVLEAAPQIGHLLASCPGLAVLATSREALSLRGEREWPLSPLPLPDLERLPALESLQRVPSVALFAARAKASDPQFALTADNARAVAVICHRVDGLPLAIELAAARVKLLAPEELASRLDRRLPLLTGGARDAPARQRTLRDAIAWSYDLLAPQEQALFRRLGVFVGGWRVEAAAAVTSLGEELEVLAGLGSLLDKSLVRVAEREGESRYSMLETVREFALEQLERDGERETTRERHAAYFVRLAERGAVSLEHAQQRRWLRLLEREHPNPREAFVTLEAAGDDAACLRLANALYFFWFIHSHAVEGLQRLGRLLSREAGGTVERARTLLSVGSLAYAVGDYVEAERRLQECEDLARRLEERRVLANVLLIRGTVAEHQGDETSAESFFQLALAIAQETGYTWLIGVAFPNLSDAAYRRGDLDLAEQFALEGFALLAASGNAYMESMNHGNVAQVALARGDVRRAGAAFGRALRVAEEIEGRWAVAGAIAGAAAVEATRGQQDGAARLLGAADAARKASGHPRLPNFHLFAQTDESVRAALGLERFRTGWDAGWALPVEDAAAEAGAALAEASDEGRVRPT